MTHVLSAGDHFVLPRLFIDAIQEVVARPDELSFSELTLPWPYVPFGAVDGVEEASGSPDDLISALDGASIAVTQMAPFSKRVFDACPSLRFVGVSRGGPVNVDLGAATAAGVVVVFAPGRNAQAAAEYAIGLMLDAMRHISTANAELKAGNWRGSYYTYDNAGTEFADETIGLVGYGAIGRIVGRVLQAFGARVLTCDPYADPSQIAADGVELTSLDSLMARSAIVSLHARLTSETRNMINSSNLALLRPGAILVNSARGGLLDYTALPNLLESGQLGALALDVYDVEPPPSDWALLASPNVVLSPHLAGATKQTARRAASVVAGEVARYLDGLAPRYVANPRVLSGQRVVR